MLELLAGDKMITVLGPWIEGYSFDLHTIDSIFLGNNGYGKPQFDTTRTPMGQCLYELKYGQHLPVINRIVELLTSNNDFNVFIKKVDIILPVPSSNKYRKIQPVLLVSKVIASKYKKETYEDVLISINKDELKNTPTEEKYKKIEESIEVDAKIDKGKCLLIFDDVFDSGSTLKAFTNALNGKGYRLICVFTLTKTRKAD